MLPQLIVTNESPTGAAGAAGSCCPRCRLVSGRTSATTGRSTHSARSCAARSISASPTLTWPTTTGRRTARRRSTSAGSCARICAVSRRAGHLHQGRLRHVARTLRRPAAPASTCSSSLDQSLHRMGLDYVDIFYSHLVRPGHAAGGNHGRARHRRAVGPRAVRGHLLLLGGADRRGRPRSCANSAPRC